MEKGYREVPHTADVALEVWGHDLADLFEHAAQGLFSLLVTLAPQAPISTQREVRLDAPDWETLLVDWLNELLLLHDEHGEAYVTFELALSGTGHLSARVGGTRAFEPRRVVKAATFHNLAIRQEDEGYRTVVVFDV